jgi:phosphohistidine phosphatase
MRVWIVRHGKAEANSALGKDADRSLAPRGEEQARWLGRMIAAHAESPDRIVSSPIKRALQTAKLINKAVGARLEESALLETGRTPSAATEVIASHQGPRPIMLVGHNPTLETLVGLLTRGPGAEYDMRTGQAVLVELDPESPIGSGSLLQVLRLDDE